MKKKPLIAIVLLFLLYAGSYIVFRSTHVEVWEKDKNAYVIFPKGNILLYYLFRPLTYLDGVFTGMRFHIGPHG